MSRSLLLAVVSLLVFAPFSPAEPDESSRLPIKSEHRPRHHNEGRASSLTRGERRSHSDQHVRPGESKVLRESATWPQGANLQLTLAREASWQLVTVKALQIEESRNQARAISVELNSKRDGTARQTTVRDRNDRPTGRPALREDGILELVQERAPNRNEPRITERDTAELVCSVSLSSPSVSESICFPQDFTWSTSDCSSLYLAFAIDSNPSSWIRLTNPVTSGVPINMATWHSVLNAFGVSADPYYWAVGELVGGSFEPRDGWRPFRDFCACCDSAGGCTDRPSSECDLFGDTPMGNGSRCNNISCPRPCSVSMSSPSVSESICFPQDFTWSTSDCSSLYLAFAIDSNPSEI